MAEDTSKFTTRKQGLETGSAFKWGGDRASWDDEVIESSGFGKKNGNLTIARPPETSVTVDTSTGDLETAFSFDATETIDPTNTSLSYEWDLGSRETRSGSTVDSYSYSSTGEFTVTVTATNEYGNSDTASVTVTVQSRSPTASFTVNRETGSTDTTFSFDGTESSDPDGTTLSYEWDFGDGVTATGSTASHSYADPGDYTVNLIVTDEHGNTDSSTNTITVNARTPTASFTMSPSNGDSDTTFTFDASGSSDPDGTALTYSWTFGDGATATGETASHSYSDAGNYTVELTVTDEYGMSDTSSTYINVDSVYLNLSTVSPTPPHSYNMAEGYLESSLVSTSYSSSKALKHEQDGRKSSSAHKHKGATVTVDLSGVDTMYYSTKFNQDGQYDALRVALDGNELLYSTSTHGWTKRTHDVSGYSGETTLWVGHKVSKGQLRQITSYVADIYFE